MSAPDTLKSLSEYTIWCGIKQRTCNPNSKDYRHYGGRGIKMCDRWKRSFALFLYDMGKRPSPRHSIDRKNVDGDYEPDNCRWSTPTVQAINHRANKGISGVTGVSYNNAKRMWRASINIDGRKKHLGYFPTIDEAAGCRHKAETKYYAPLLNDSVAV